MASELTMSPPPCSVVHMSNTTTSISNQRRIFDDNRRMIVTQARRVGRVLAAAGYTKATRYRTFGREVDGYEVGSGSETVWVGITVNGDDGFQLACNIQQTLEEAGFDVTEAQPPVNGIVSNIRVKVPGVIR